ncbi:hypothetical protein [Arthrobacter sp. zg-Y877]|nr:hypothetical protein [Arthrobacter sp. zg-Y877]MDM7991524.1 hypothetical protein [Arthrobacter sp. zg-Y877]
MPSPQPSHVVDGDGDGDADARWRVRLVGTGPQAGPWMRKASTAA